jgi:hypothetical protein
VRVMSFDLCGGISVLVDGAGARRSTSATGSRGDKDAVHFTRVDSSSQFT